MAISTTINTLLADQMFAIFSHAETLMLEKVAKRVSRGITEEGWAERKLKDTQAFREELQRITEDTEKLAKSRLSSSVIQAFQSGINSAEGDFGLPKTILSSTILPASLQRLVMEANGIMVRTSNSILRDVMDKYRSIQAEVATGVLTGVETRKQIAQRMLNRFADEGITGFVDKAGRKWEMASYAEMATRTVTARSAIQGHIDRQAEFGRDLVVISDHAGECPVCRPWEGVVLSISGNDPNYTSLSQAQNSGLFHPNCRHTLTGYIPGLTKLDKQPNSGVSEQYEYTQEQRYNERQIRHWKRREVVAITPNDQLLARSKIREYQAKQRELLTNYEEQFGMSLRRKYDRESIKNRSGIKGMDDAPKWLKTPQRQIPKPAKPPKPEVPKAIPFDYKKYKNIQRGDIEKETNAFWSTLTDEEKQATRRYIATGNSFELNKFLYTGEYDKAQITLSKMPELDNSIDLLKQKEVELRRKHRELRDKGASQIELDKIGDEVRKIRDSIMDLKDTKDEFESRYIAKINEIDKFSKIVQKATIPDDIKVVRNVDSDFMGYVFNQANIKLGDKTKNALSSLSRGISEEDAIDLVDSLNLSLSGIKYKNQSFTSTSYNASENVFTSRPIQLEFCVDKGTTGLITQNWHESEIVFDKGTEVEIMSFGFDEVQQRGRSKIILKIMARILK